MFNLNTIVFAHNHYPKVPAPAQVEPALPKDTAHRPVQAVPETGLGITIFYYLTSLGNVVIMEVVPVG